MRFLLVIIVTNVVLDETVRKEETKTTITHNAMYRRPRTGTGGTSTKFLRAPVPASYRSAGASGDSR
jgi:hypothetical protein